jgi:hypothetical protein
MLEFPVAVLPPCITGHLPSFDIAVSFAGLEDDRLCQYIDIGQYILAMPLIGIFTPAACDLQALIVEGFDPARDDGSAHGLS